MTTRFSHISFLVAGICMLCSAKFASATVLTFNITDPLPANGTSLLTLDTYGDNVNSTFEDEAGPGGEDYNYLEGNGFTPNVEVGYSALNQDNNNDGFLNGYRFWGTLDWAGGVAFLRGVGDSAALTQYDTTFTPDATHGVRVNSFVVDDFDGFAAGHTINWFVYRDAVDPGNILASAAGVAVAPNQELTINTGLTDFHNGVVILRVQHSAGAGNDLAIDNINFDQLATTSTSASAPEPSSAVLVLFALVGFAVRKRRCHR